MNVELHLDFVSRVRIPPVPPIGAVAQRVEQKKVSRPTCRHGPRTIAANADGTTASHVGQPVGFDSPPGRRSLARAGLPMFRLPCRRDHHAWRMQAGLQDRAPGTSREVGRSSRPPRPQGRGVAQKPSCRSSSPDWKDECVQDYIGTGGSIPPDRPKGLSMVLQPLVVRPSMPSGLPRDYR